MKVVLISPYTGANLGDAAIQEAVISNVRRRDANADIVLVSLAPEVTARLHGVAGFPISLRTLAPGFDLPGSDDSAPPVQAGLL